MDKKSYFNGTGRRKTATAQVKLMPGNGAIIIDGKPLEERFPSIEHQHINLPFITTESVGKYNAVIKVLGGGITGQSAAIAHGISRRWYRLTSGLNPCRGKTACLPGTPAPRSEAFGLRRARKALNIQNVSIQYSTIERAPLITSGRFLFGALLDPFMALN